MMHSDDASRLDMLDGEIIRVRTRIGAIELPLEVTDELMPRVVSIPHGFGHHREGIRLNNAKKVAGVSVNDITDTQAIDSLTGVSIFNGFSVTVEKRAATA